MSVVCCLNAGSSSLKFALYRCEEATQTLLARGAVEQIGTADGRLWLTTAASQPVIDRRGAYRDHPEAVHAALTALAELDVPAPAVVGHRLVQGGPRHGAPAEVNDELLADLRAHVPLAPLHLPAEIDGIEAVRASRPGLPQVACFDTAFHEQMPTVAKRLPLPDWLWAAGVRRYGFHGLSYEYVLSQLPAGGRVVMAHLGSGASMAAVRDGQPLDTTMGFTPTGGFPMSSRSGDLDPGVLLWLLRERGYDAPRLEELVDRNAGLVGVSGGTGDMRSLLAARDHGERAALAVDLYCYHLGKHIGALAAVLNGLDTLVFTGGVGERAAPIRAETALMLGHLGVQIDDEANERHADVISSPGSPCTVRVIPTDEDLMIARHAVDVLAGHPRPTPSPQRAGPEEATS